jgi:hypothetical protein
MPSLNIQLLINMLRRRQTNIYNLYVYTNDLSLADALLHESQSLGYIIDQLKILIDSGN